MLGVQTFHLILLIKLRMSEWRLLIKLLEKTLGRKERMPVMVPTSSVSAVDLLMVQLMSPVVMPSTPVMRAVAFRLSSLCVFQP